MQPGTAFYEASERLQAIDEGWMAKNARSMKNTESVADVLESRVNRTSPLASNRKISRKTEGVQSAILAAAGSIFAEKGYYLTKLSDISDKIGTHVTALRYHFPSKDAIAEAIVNRVTLAFMEHLRETLAELGPEASSREKITAAVQSYMHIASERRVDIIAHGNIVNQLPQEARMGHFALLREFLDIWRDLIGEAAQRGELAPGISASIATQVVLGSVIWTREWYRPELGAPDRIAGEITKVLLGGLIASPGAEAPSARSSEKDHSAGSWVAASEK